MGKHIEILQAKEVRLANIEPNTGQIQGLPKNPRVIRDVKYKLLLKSIEEMPEMMSLRELLVFPAKLGGVEKYVIIGGNMRYNALKELGYTTAPCKILSPDTPVEFMRNVLLRDNSSYGEWDIDALTNDFTIDELDDATIDLPPIEEVPEDQEAQEDNFNVSETIPQQPKSKLGDIYRLGEHRLICGDSTKWEFVEALMDGCQADLIVTDPPYNVDYESADGKKIENDHMEDSAFFEFLKAAFTVGDQALKPGGSFYIWHADSEGYNFRGACKEVGWKVRQVLIWNKNALVLGRQDYQWKHEPCLYGWKEGAGHYFINRRDLTTVQEDIMSLDIESMSKAELKETLKRLLDPEVTPVTVINENKPLKSAEHPTMKPLKLIGRLVRNSARPGEIVLDMFGGSGSTMMAAEQLGRRCFMVEFDPKYVDVIVKRWEDMTGKRSEYLGNMLQGENSTEIDN